MNVPALIASMSGGRQEPLVTGPVSRMSKSSSSPKSVKSRSLIFSCTGMVSRRSHVSSVSFLMGIILVSSSFCVWVSSSMLDMARTSLAWALATGPSEALPQCRALSCSWLLLPLVSISASPWIWEDKGFSWNVFSLPDSEEPLAKSMSSINLVSEEMVLQESVTSDRTKRDPAGREGEAGTICLEGAGGAGSVWSWSPASQWDMLRCRHFDQEGTTSPSKALCVTETSMGWGPRGHPKDPDELGAHTLAAPTYAGWLHPRIRSAVVSFPCKSSRMLQCGITEDIEPSLGHGRDLLLLGCSQVLQKASSARWGGCWLGAKQGWGQ